jgi:hypothetical protein
MKPIHALAFLVFVFICCNTDAEQVYSHLSGVQFKYPDGWTIKDSAFADFEIVPPDVVSNQYGPVETYFQWSFRFEPSEEKVAENLEILIPRVVPFLERTGEIEHFPVSNAQGMILSWSGKSEDGQDVWSSVFVIPGKEMSIAFVAIGEKKKIEERANAIRAILATYTFGDGKRDNSVVGKWGSTVQEPCSNGELTGTGEITSGLQLDPPGTFQMTESARFQGCGVDPEGKNGDYDHSFDGIWFAGDGRLYLVSSQNTSMTFSFNIQGEKGSRELTLNHATGRSQVLNEKISQ